MPAFSCRARDVANVSLSFKRPFKARRSASTPYSLNNRVQKQLRTSDPRPPARQGLLSIVTLTRKHHRAGRLLGFPPRPRGSRNLRDSVCRLCCVGWCGSGAQRHIHKIDIEAPAAASHAALEETQTRGNTKHTRTHTHATPAEQSQYREVKILESVFHYISCHQIWGDMRGYGGYSSGIQRVMRRNISATAG